MIFICGSKKKNLQNLIDDLHLDVYQKKIIEERYLGEVSLYSMKAKVTEFFYIFLSIFVTIATIILPALLSIQEIDYSDDEDEDRSFKKKIYWTTFVVSLLITISNGLVQFLNLHQQFVSYNQTKEKLLAQGWHYLQLSGSYKGKSHRDNFIDFCESVEKIKKSQVSKELMFISDGQDKKDDSSKNIKKDCDSMENVSLDIQTKTQDNLNKSGNMVTKV
jgi:hypothetical protein